MRKRKGWKLQMAVAGALSLVAATALAGQVTLYERPAFQGQSATTTVALPNLARSYFNDGASSIVVTQRRPSAALTTAIAGTIRSHGDPGRNGTTPIANTRAPLA